ncbi:MAG: amidohydrolase/deacetylase family metallohydrolase, partial [bacterium]
MTGKVDLLLKGGRVMDPSVGLDANKDVAFTDGKISAILDSNSPVEAKEVQDVSGCIVCPGLIDLHTHVYWGGTGLGVNAEDIAGRSATTTFIDAGSAGAGNFGGLKHFIADTTDLRILGF